MLCPLSPHPHPNSVSKVREAADQPGTTEQWEEWWGFWLKEQCRNEREACWAQEWGGSSGKCPQAPQQDCLRNSLWQWQFQRPPKYLLLLLLLLLE